MGIKKTLSKEYISENPVLKVRKDVVELDNKKTQERTVIEVLPGSMIFALTEKNEVLLVKNYCHARDSFELELPAGYIDKNETPEQAAKRELMEETGYEAEDIEYLGEVRVAPTYSTKISYLFLARKIKKVSQQNLDDSEKVEVIKVPLQKLLKMINNNEIKSGDTIINILLALKKLNILKSD
jgi:ADP-ribose pyrophosphatase